MKRNISLRFFLALMAGMLIIAISGCDNSTSPNVDISDDPAQGFMSKATADAIFEWTTEKNGVRIGKFRNADALRSYLAGITRAAASPTSLVINRINGMPVTSIAEGAFSPAAGAADITTVVSTITLPETITSLGADLFAGASQPVTVDIPPAVADKISQPALEAAAGGKATIQKVDPSGEPQVIVQGPSSGSSGGSGSTGPSGPAAPSIAVLSGNAELTVTWAAVSGATGYEVYYHTSNTTTGAT
ncbi:MAG: hypothetical protein LBB78_07570, partial [Spirochaetaceae bacterium]|nr:hypothetical protein [Spirochaetaceae bacterium]